ncbi:sensor histidine kinase [Cryptosporangium sp. NPDC048952]|uniref:sensor histidine kinase n=1 Tax=Cryptosporangium sp. NPDC048952 TaxID=3363961 RepID=UPI0037105969
MRRLRVVPLVVIVLLCAVIVAATGNQGGPPAVPPLFVVLAWPILLRKRPVLALGLVLLFTALLTPLYDPETVGPVGCVAVLIAVGRLAAVRPWRVSVPGAAVALVVVALLGTAFYVRGGGAINTAGVLALAIVSVWAVGNTIRQAGDNAAARRREETELAVAAERLRIARELHDLVAHSMGVIAFQAGAGRRVIDTRPVEARNALDAIETTSREALAELRRTLAALRRSEPEGAPTLPTPRLADLDRLAASVRVAVVRTGEVRDLPADLELSAYRIVQESVTNVVRHAGTDSCRVTLDYRDDALAIEVLDSGTPGTMGTGYGIIGMRERVTLLNGEFEAGPRPEGGFRVAATIPIHD